MNMRHIPKYTWMENRICGILLFFASLFLCSTVEAQWITTVEMSYNDCGGYLQGNFRLEQGYFDCNDSDRLGSMYVSDETGKILYVLLDKNSYNQASADNLVNTYNVNFPGYSYNRRDVYANHCGSWWLVSTTGVDFTAANQFMDIKVYDISNSVFNKSTTIQASGHWDYYYAGGENFGPSYSGTSNGRFTINIGASETTTNFGSLSATDNVCDRVNLSWSSLSLGCSSGQRGIDIDRKAEGGNWTQLAYGLSFTQTSYSDLTAVIGVKYQYRIRHRFTPNTRGRGTFYSNWTETANGQAGERPGIPPQVAGMVASDDDCNQAIDLSWTYNGVGNQAISSYSIDRRLKGTANWSTIESGYMNTLYTDNNVDPSVIYEYRVLAYNSCNLFSTGPIVEGISPAIPSAPSNLQIGVNHSTREISLSWSDNSFDETEFIIVRSIGSLSEELPAITSTNTAGTGVVNYVDSQIEICKNYIYTIKAKNDCGPSIPSNSVGALLQADFSQAFSSGFIDASKGYFTNRVQLEWSLSGNAADLLEAYKISRRVYGTTDRFVLLEQIDGGGIYNDLIADAGILYEYQVFGFAECGSAGSKIYSDTSYTVGFRSKSGLVTGNVSYAGGNAVKDVKIIAESSEPSVGKSIAINGGKISIDYDVNQNLDSVLVIDTWIKPAGYSSDFQIAKKTGSFELGYVHSQGRYVFKVINNGIEESISVPKDTFPINTWKQIAVQVSDSLYIYRDGKVVARSALNTKPAVLTNPINTPIDLFNGFYGNALEFRMWRNSKSADQIIRDASRFASGIEKGLICLLPMSEGFGNFTYDRSKITATTYNKNDGRMMGGAVFITDLPSISQLGHASYTDTIGNYLLYLPFTNAGENYELFPQYFTHEFDPKKRLIYIGDGSTILNNIDFLDKSSFEMTGELYYAGTNVAVADATVKIDGQVVQVNGSIVKTNQDGQFTIQVPIGNHYIQLEKPGHTFSIGRFPPAEGTAWPFQAPVGPVPFEDNTLIKVVGRAIGGSIQADKPPGMGRSKNNIGKAEIRFQNTNTDKGWFVGDPALNITRPDTTIYTDSASGEYIIELPPWVYSVQRVELVSDPTAIDFGGQSDLDLRYEIEQGKVQSLKREIDTLFLTNTNTVSRIDSITYHQERNFVYYSDPSIEVLDRKGDEFKGDTLAFFEHSKYPFDTLNLNTTPLLFPVLTSGRQYDTKIHIFEEYFNIDRPGAPGDRVPVIKGDFVISNKLAVEPDFSIDLEAADTLNGVIPYSFIADEPLIQQNSEDVDYSYTKAFNITITDPSFKVHIWEPFDFSADLPNLLNPNKFFRAYIFGSKNDPGTNFAVQGPSILNYILRDPPGGGSFSTLAKGSTITESLNWSVSAGVGANLNTIIGAGTKFLIGLGSITTTELINQTTLGLNVDSQFGHNESVVTSRTVNTTLNTSSNPNNVGAGSDLFIGTSNNYLFGVSNQLGLFSDDACETSVAECFGESVNGFRIGEAVRFGIEGKEIATDFFLTQKDIEYYEIPYLIKLRDDLLKNDPRYVPVITDTLSEYFGKNNDDFEAFGQDTCRCYHWLPFPKDPPSYRFVAHQDSVDQVRKFNEQIRLWKEALALNERDKIESTEKVQNWSFDGGGSSLERSVTTDTTISKGFTWEIVLTESVRLKVGGKINSTGLEVENSISITEKTSGNETTETMNTTTVGYTITDDDIWDRYTVDVIPSKMGFGPIFKIRGGETSCPHEGELVSKYYQPGTVISSGTVQLEQPTLSVNKDKITNIPDGQAADFVFTLGNDSKETWAYTLGLINSSNPGQAIIVNSGTSQLGSAFTVPAKGSLPVHVLIERGGAYVHDSLLFVLQSSCQYDPGDFDPDIGDSVYISINYIPACTDIEIFRPNDNWILNKSYDNKMEIIMSNYNINATNFNNFILEYKPSNVANFRPLNTFFLDTVGVTSSNSFSEISQTTTSTKYIWDVSGLPDDYYDLRVTTDCLNAQSESDIHSGFIDREPIEVFGTPSPADGVLDPNDDILLTMNEEIVSGGITSKNFDVRGVLNGTTLKNETSISFDGTGAYLEIPEYQLQRRSFSIEFWLKRSSLGEEVIFAQGLSPQDQILISFTSDDKIRFQVGDAFILSEVAIEDTDWRHYAFNYNRETNTAEIFTRHETLPATFYNASLSADFGSTGLINIGRNTTGSPSYFKGFIHELRLWSIARSSGDISSLSQVTMSGRESGLIGTWPMDEAFGNVAKDKVRSRHAQLKNATWSILPSNHSFSFSRNNKDFLVADGTGDLGIFDDQDMTIEVWFKTSSTTIQSILSNGSPDQKFAWNIYMDNTGAVIIENDGQSLRTSGGFNDNVWHHFSAVIERTRAVSLYIDGLLVKTGNASTFTGGFNGPKLWIGARGWVLQNRDTVDRFFNGKLDDIRIWDIARKSEQIQRDIVNQMVGDELGLVAYYPFDGITEVGTILTRDPNLKDAVGVASPGTGHDLSLGGTTSLNFDTEAPRIKLPRLIEKVKVDYSINGDQIYIELSVPPARAENVTFDITVSGLKDKAGNFMASPETWIAYINKNQVFWQDEYFNFEKKLDGPLSFKAKIKNTGGRQERYSLGNLPDWLIATPSSGLIGPNSTVEITFTVQSLLNIGEYEQDIFVSTESFGFNERLLLDLKVSVDPPTWAVNDSSFSHSMNIIGQLQVNNVISVDEEDIVSVWVNNVLRGVAHVSYDKSSGKYLVFLTVNSNVTSGEILEFRVWDASEGRLLVDVMPNNMIFLVNDIKGSRGTPIPILSTRLTELTYQVQAGWTWLSFPLAHSSLSNVNTIFSGLNATVNDEIKSQTKFHNFNGTVWMGSLPGFDTNQGYKLRSAKSGTFKYAGTFADPSTDPIAIVVGWNWIGVKNEFIIDVASAMASLDPQTGDLIKGQRSFAIYEDGFGWGGSLEFLEPKKGYMLKYHMQDELYFPGNVNMKERTPVHLKSLGREELLMASKTGYSEGKFSGNMSMIASIGNCQSLESYPDNWYLVAYARDECRGYAKQSSDGKFYLSIDGDVNTALTFRLVNSATSVQIVLNETIDFAANNIVGMISTPYEFSCGRVILCDNESMVHTADLKMDQAETLFKADRTLMSDAVVPPGHRLLLRAGGTVELLTSFEIVGGAQLEVLIADCKDGND